MAKLPKPSATSLKPQGHRPAVATGMIALAWSSGEGSQERVACRIVPARITLVRL